MHSRSQAERGSITAEFAATVPAVVLVLACCLASVQLAGTQIRMQDAASMTARSVARGEPAPAFAGSTVATWRKGDLVCVRLSAASQTPVGTLLALTVAAESCALAGGG